MEEYQQFFSKVVLIKTAEVDYASLLEQNLELQVDLAYAIDKSVAVLYKETVIDHLTRNSAKPVSIHLRFGHRIEAHVYKEVHGFENSICFSTRSKAPELGIRIKIVFKDFIDGGRRVSGMDQAKGFLSYMMKHRINSFPGVTWSNCPPALQYLI